MTAVITSTTPLAQLSGPAERIKEAIKVAQLFLTSSHSHLIGDAAAVVERYDTSPLVREISERMEMVRHVYSDVQGGKTAEEIADDFEITLEESEKLVTASRLIASIAI